MKAGDRIIFLVSLLVAFAIWFMSELSREYAGTISVPVTAECNLDGHSTLSSNTAVVSARCRTDGYRLLQERSRKERRPVRVRFASGDLHRTGPDSFCITGNAIHTYVDQFFGGGTVVEAFITDSLVFTFPRENHRKVPVEVPLSVGYRSQYMRSAPFRVTPDSVTVYGDAERLENIVRVKTAPVTFGDVHETMHGSLRLDRVKGVRLSVEEVSYELPVSRYVELRSTVPIEVWNAPAGKRLQVFPSSAEVVLRAAFPLARDPFESFRLYVDYQDFNASLGGRCVPQPFQLPAGVLDYRLEPEVFDCIELER